MKKIAIVVVLLSFAIVVFGSWNSTDDISWDADTTTACDITGASKATCYHPTLIGTGNYWGISTVTEATGDETLIHGSYKCASCGKKIIIHTASAHKPNIFTKEQEEALEVALRALIDPNL